MIKMDFVYHGVVKAYLEQVFNFILNAKGMIL